MSGMTGPQPYAQINSSTNMVVNIVTLDPASSTFDPSYTWVAITGLSCSDGTPIVPGCTYSDSAFTSMPLDTYSRSVTYQTDLTTDTYTVTDIGNNQFQVQEPYGTSQSTAYTTIEGTNVPTLAAAISQVVTNFANAQMAYVQSFYSLQQQMQLLILYMAAMAAGNLPNRVAYIAQLFTWINSITSYDLSFAASVKSQTTAAAACAMNGTWNFSANVSANPGVTATAAIQIND